jgi:glycosyltransferase involved in cell wall biosynthesis
LKILLLNQCFYPDVVSTAQHLTDLALGLAEQGHQVTVIASDRGYDNPANRFPRREHWKGIDIIRIPSVSIGKKSKWRRALNFSSFLSICATRLLFSSPYDVVVSLTSPPLISFLGSLFVKLKGGKMVFWVMDMNPDEAIAAGWLKKDSFTARFLSSFLNYSFRHSARIVALDRFMRARIMRKGIEENKIVTIAPWSHSDSVRFDEAGRHAFRREHGLSEKFVVMYSGNHSPCHPLDTLVRAARDLKDHPEITFAFIGGGSEQTRVREFARAKNLENVICLPYQPLEKLSGSLSAADLHAVVMGDEFAGIVHPCKIYNVLEVEAPLLYIGPAESHVTDLIKDFDTATIAGSVRHGDVAGTVHHILSVSSSKQAPRNASHLTASFSKQTLLPKLLVVIESLSNQPVMSAAISDTGKEPLPQKPY